MIKIKNKILNIILALVVLLATGDVNYAENNQQLINIPVMQRSREQGRWYYRDHNGKRQRRLWSMSVGRWMTDWKYID